MGRVLALLFAHSDLIPLLHMVHCGLPAVTPEYRDNSKHWAPMGVAKGGEGGKEEEEEEQEEEEKRENKDEQDKMRRGWEEVKKGEEKHKLVLLLINCQLFFNNHLILHKLRD